MPAAKPLVVDFMREDVRNSILPHPPLFSSKQAGWNGIYLECHRQPAHQSPKHRHAQHLISIHCGRPVTVERWADGCFQREHLVYGDISIFPAGQDESVRWDREIDWIDLFLEPALLEVAEPELNSTTQVEIVGQLKVSDPLIQQMGLALLAELESDALGSRIYAEAMATTLAVHLLRRYCARSQTIREYSEGLTKYKLQQAIDYINEYLNQDLTVAAIANVVQMSPYHFSRLFKQSTGLAPHQYVIQCRVERAKQLLLRRELTIAEVAYRAGFANQSHLNRHFKRLLGVTPRAVLCK
jgi:AraC family transcriptional regulator